MKKKDLRRLILGCQLCELSSRPYIKPVPWRGPMPADIVIIGEAPGRDENIEGRPFIGRSGKLLSETLQRVGLDESNICIMNTVCCYPGRAPNDYEIQACSVNLKDQLKKAKPSYALLLGSIAMRSFIDGYITQEHGRWFKREGIRMMPVYHPAYVLRNRKRLLPAFRKDLRRFARRATA